ncbi:hypothetical protein MUO14_08730 [Halobacillus shinanisalinarum]|uniref:DUF1634 domain-containing protein n=1 Tax=Halobacillus shinanisalinarum TaxID=2932258 RepID=A0ABY4H3F3_9BACI|nr:hypothetical protein [Halobacillus shinanisalinarum]UOQ94993.1 hypothetical protein MUO14_08730 [Halobacillus shinanisalinarum]
MNKQLISVTAVYALIMAVLLILTFQFGWNPSGYSYEVNGSTLTVQKGLAHSDVTTVEISEHMSDVLLFQVAMSDVKTHWHTDIIMLALFFPLILFAVFKDKRPFKKVLSYKWFLGIVCAIILVYTAATVPNYFSQIQKVEENVQKLSD